MGKSCCSKNSPSSASAGKSNGISVCGNTRVEHVSIDDSDEDEHCCAQNGLTKIIAEADIGFGNTLYIRGAGCGLNWDKGVAMKNKDAKFWMFECDKCKGKGNFEYKLLINDETWNTGENFIAKCCGKNIVTPEF